ncbi:MAG TPA: ABC transporter substrate-binding protein [Acidimicrobiales bacterium]|nr:ABC transporter substrate-binding protein [Acidimicrobiales bacterium]
MGRLGLFGSFRAVGAGLLALALGLSVAACGGSSNSPSSSSGTGASAKESIVVTSANFSEDELLADMYADVLSKAGYKVTKKLNIGTREVYLQAMEHGELDLVPDYVGSLTQVLNTDQNGPNANTTKPLASGDLQATLGNLRPMLDKVGLVALDPSPAADQNGYGVTAATSSQDHLTSLDQLSKYSPQFVFGGPPECQTRADCLPGLKTVYGASFKSFKALDAGGPLTLNALTNGDIQVGVVFTSDGAVAAKNLVVLDDPKHLAPVDNILPVMRKAKYNSAVAALINKVSAALTTDELRSLNKQIGVDKADPATVAQTFLAQHGL